LSRRGISPQAFSGIRFEEAEGDDTESWNAWVDSL